MPNDPVSEYITAKFKVSGLKKTDVVTRIGYKNLGKGLRRFDNVLAGGAEDIRFMKKLAEVLGFPFDELYEIYEERRRKREEKEYREEKAAFQPFLFAVTVNSCPSPIFAGAIFGRRLRINLEDDFSEIAYIDQLARVSGHIRAHMAMTGGTIPAFKEIKYYRLKRVFEEPASEMLFFDTDGALRDNPNPGTAPEPGKAVLIVKGRNILPILQIENEQEGL